MYLVCFSLMQKSISENGLILSAFCNRLSVIGPILMGIVVFGEKPSSAQIIGVAISLMSIIIINYTESNQTSNPITSHSLSLLLILFICSCLTDSLSVIYEKETLGYNKDLYLLFSFFSAFLLSTAMSTVGKKFPGKEEFVFGTLLGIPSFFASRFLIQALSCVPAVIAYPVLNISSVVLITLAGGLWFKEKFNRTKRIGFLLVLIALLLLYS